MKNRLALLIGLLFLSINAFAQISFEKGYFIDNSGKKTDCLIKNADWQNNPSDFKYKITENGENRTGTLQDVQEFFVANQKFVRFEVQIDLSSSYPEKMSKVRNPEFTKETLFLKTLLEGKANLYFYRKGDDLLRYFYKTGDSTIQQLVSKNYLTDGQVKSNWYYRQQIVQTLVCDTKINTYINQLTYTHKDLIKVFTQYNECLGKKVVLYETARKRGKFILNIKGGMNLATFSGKNEKNPYFDVNFPTKMAFRIGAELEYILPFNKNKWSIFVEPTFQYYKAETTMGENSQYLNPQQIRLNYQSIELPVGLRYYMFLTNRSKLFINVAYIFDYPQGSNFYFDAFQDLTINPKQSFALGIGYNYDNKFHIELRGITPRELGGEYSYWSDTNYQYFTFMVGFNVLGFK